MKVYVNKEQSFLWTMSNEYMGGWELGITPAAREEIGEITYVEPPQKGRIYFKDEVFSTVESRKGVWELKMPFAARCFTEHKATAETMNRDWKEALGFFLLCEGFKREGWEEQDL